MLDVDKCAAEDVIQWQYCWCAVTHKYVRVSML